MSKFTVKAAFCKIKDKEKYDERYDLCNHFNFVEFDALKIDIIRTAYNINMEQTESMVCTTFDAYSEEWAFQPSLPGEEEDIFITAENMEMIIGICKKGCEDILLEHGFDKKGKKIVKDWERKPMVRLDDFPLNKLFTMSVTRDDDKVVQISDKYFKRYAYPPKYRYKDIQNDKLAGTFTNKKRKMDSKIDIEQDTKQDTICSAVWIQPMDKNAKNYKDNSYYAVQHYRRGFELASERGTYDDNTYLDMARRTLVKELNVDCMDKIDIIGKIVENGNSKIFLFSVENFPRMQPYIPIHIQDKNIIGSGFVRYSELRPWSKFHINIFNGALNNKSAMK